MIPASSRNSTPNSKSDLRIRYEFNDEVQINIPDPEDPDYRYHQEHGEIVGIFRDGLGELTGDSEHDFLYTVDFYDDQLDKIDFRYDDLQRI
jgi:hypothetical protein